MSETTLVDDNAYIILGFDESIYGNADATGPIDIGDIQCDVVEPLSSNVSE